MNVLLYCRVKSKTSSLNEQEICQTCSCTRRHANSRVFFSSKCCFKLLVLWFISWWTVTNPLWRLMILPLISEAERWRYSTLPLCCGMCQATAFILNAGLPNSKSFFGVWQQCADRSDWKLWYGDVHRVMSTSATPTGFSEVWIKQRLSFRSRLWALSLASKCPVSWISHIRWTPIKV